MNEQPDVIRRGLVDMQVCVPENWSDKQVVDYANLKKPCGTEFGWVIRKDGDPALRGDPERRPCQIKTGYVHIILDA